MKFLIFVYLIFLLLCSAVSQVQQEWVARYAPYGNNLDQAFSIKNDNFGNVYITGISSSSEIHYDYATIKYNSSGVQEWIQRFGGTSSAYGRALALDNNRNVYVTGYFNAPGLGNTDIATIKYNNSGSTLSVYEFSGSSNGFDKAFYINCDIPGKL